MDPRPDARADAHSDACPDATGEGPDGAAVEAAAFVLGLRAQGVRDTAVLGAMERVPREHFAPRRLRDLARRDVALPLACGQTMTAPGLVAAMLLALGVRPGARVLEVGTGSGYVAALLARLGAARVVSLERFATLAAEAAARLRAGGFDGGVEVAVGDGREPAGEGVYDRILVNGALPGLPSALTSRLAPGGRLVGALAVDALPRLVACERDAASGRLEQRLLGPARLGTLVPGVAAAL